MRGETKEWQANDREGTLVISAPRTGNRLYTLKLGVVPPICLLMNMDNQAWKWHARYGHLNFRALRDLFFLREIGGVAPY